MSAKEIDVYDFDHTVYAGNAMVDFYLYALSRQPALLRFVPIQLWHLVFFLAKLEGRATFKSHYFVFLKGVKNHDVMVQSFWEKNFAKIKTWYVSRGHGSDVIISASPDFLLSEICQQLKVKKLIATELDVSTGKVIGANCYGPEKLRRLQTELPGATIRNCYSDSLSDLPILNAAKKGYLVKGDKITPLTEEKR